MDGGSDILMVQSIFDTLNTNDALYAVGEYLEINGFNIPVFVSGTLGDQSGRKQTCTFVRKICDGRWSNSGRCEICSTDVSFKYSNINNLNSLVS